MSDLANTGVCAVISRDCISLVFDVPFLPSTLYLKSQVAMNPDHKKGGWILRGMPQKRNPRTMWCTRQSSSMNSNSMEG